MAANVDGDRRAQILVVGTPIWLGHPASPCQVVMERLDVLIAEEGGDGRPVLWDKVAVLAVVDNEDGAHHITAEVFQGLNDCGFTVPPGGARLLGRGGNGSIDFKDLADVPDAVRTTAVRTRVERLRTSQPHCADRPTRHRLNIERFT